MANQPDVTVFRVQEGGGAGEPGGNQQNGTHFGANLPKHHHVTTGVSGNKKNTS